MAQQPPRPPRPRNDSDDRRGGQRPGGAGSDRRGPPGQPGGRHGAPGPAPRRDEDRGDRERREGAELEFLLIRPGGCLSATLSHGYLPLRWQPHREVSLFRPGLYLRHAGGLHLVGRDLAFDDAVLYASWDDPDANYRLTPDRSVRPGVHAALLIRSPLADGPPWIPITAGVAVTPHELESGILSPFLDQVSSVRFRAVLNPGRDTMTVASTRAAEEESGGGAVRETLLHLAKAADDVSPAAAAVRRMLVDNGHGLHRVGIGLMHADDAERAHLLRAVLGGLAPDVAPVLQALWNVWSLDDEAGAPARARALLDALHPLLRPESPVRSGAQLGTLVTWLVGLFGPRPERSGQWPALSLFAACRYLRSVMRRPELYDHADAPMPAFPFTRAAFAATVRELGSFPPEESDIERVIRALAAAEVASELPRPRLEHLRAFKVMFPRLKGYPVAARTWLARYEHLLTGWSYRGAELRDGRADARNLESNLILDVPTVGVLRAYARVLGSAGPASSALASALSRAEHPMYAQLSTLTFVEGDASAHDAAIHRRFDEASQSKRLTRDALAQASSIIDFIVARAQSQNPLVGAALREPTVGGDHPVRSHFLYWRAFCRSIVPNDPARYEAFLDGLTGSYAQLPLKLQIEAASLARQTGRKNEPWTGRATWAGLVASTVDALLATPDAADVRPDRVQDLLASLADLDGGAFADRFERCLGLPWMSGPELARLLETARRSTGRDAVVSSEDFAALHDRLCGAPGLAGARARAEWVRCAIDRARNVSSVRWLLELSGDNAWIHSSAFSTWFAGPGKQAPAFAENAVVELLELAVRAVCDEHIDLVMAQISNHTRWPASEKLKLLLESNRHAAALDWMQLTATGDEAQARESVEKLLAGADDGRTLRAAAIAVRDLEGRTGHPQPLLREHLMAAYRAYRPHRSLLDGFARALDGWRVAGLPASGAELAALVDKAGKWGIESGHRGLLNFVAWVSEQHAAATLAPSLLALATGEGAAGAVLDAVDGLEPASSLTGTVAAWAALPPREAASRTVKGALTSGALADTVRRAVVRAVADALQHTTDPAALHPGLVERLSGLRARLAAVAPEVDEPELAAEAAGIEEPVAEPQPDASAEPVALAPADDSAEPQDTGTPEPAAEVEAAATEGLPEAPSGIAVAADAPPAREARPRREKKPAPPPAEKLVAAYRARAREQIASGIELALSLLSEIEPSLVWASLPMIRRVRDFSPAIHETRREVLGVVGAVASSDHIRVHDGRYLTTTDFLDGDVVELDRTDLAVVLSLLVGLRQRFDLVPKFELRRGGVALPLLLASPQARTARVAGARSAQKSHAAPDADVGETLVSGEADTTFEASSAEAPGEPGDNLPGSVLAEPGDSAPEAAAPEAAAPEAGAAPTDEAADASPRKLSGKALIKLLRAGLDDAADRESRIAAFGDELTPLVARILLARNRNLRLRFDVEEGQPLAIVSWKERR